MVKSNLLIIQWGWNVMRFHFQNSKVEEIGQRILDAATHISYIFTGCSSGNIEAVSRASNPEDEKTVWRVADIINLKFLL
ncbi:hypothetical protein Peur_009483 [Populus x canadensis]